MSVQEKSEGMARGRCLECGSENVRHHHLGMPVYEAVQRAPHWISWSCFSGSQNRSCDDSDFLWWSQGELAGFQSEARAKKLLGRSA